LSALSFFTARLRLAAKRCGVYGDSMTATAEPTGLLVLDKPGGMTSREALDRALRWFPRGTSAGHTGTLDPLATGTLVLCLGKATRLAEYVQAMPKVYRTDIRLGAVSDSDDADGTVTPVDGAVPPTPEAVARAVAGLVGEIEQVPPAFSAAKVAGRRAYDLARRGTAVDLAPRRVTVSAIDVLDYAWPRLTLEVRCGKGTYIRSLARDLGRALGCGGYVETLRRLRVGPFTAADGLRPDADPTEAASRLLPMSAAVAELPHLRVSAAEAARLRQGQAVAAEAKSLAAAMRREGVVPGRGEVAVFEGPTLIAVAAVGEGRALRPVKVLG
jgi:tRNA pseudouridine55 synthase